MDLLGNAAGKAVDFLGDVVKAGMEEEASISRLGASLKANIPAWDGRTDAIERVLAAQVSLGFSDDEQRNSLALLVAATHDETKALQIMRTAMDLARFKRISLSEATDALTKVEAGSYRILKSLGIVLKDNATQTEALAAVQAVAEDQAADYAETTEGKLLVAQTKFGEKMDELGTKTLPLVTKGLDLVTLAIDGATALVPDLTSTTYELAEAEAQVTGELSDATAYLLVHGKALKTNADWAADYAKKARALAPRIVDIGGAADTAADGLGDMGDKADDAAAALKRAEDAWKSLNDRIEQSDEFANLPDKITVAEAAAEQALKELRDAIKSGNEVAIAAARIAMRNAASELAALRREWARLRVQMERPVHVGGVYHPGGGTGADRVPLAGGMPFVPHDNLPALLHQGEAVLTKPEAEEWRSGGSGLPLPGGGGTNIYVTANLSPTGYSPAQAEQLANAVGPAITRYLRQRGLLKAG